MTYINYNNNHQNIFLFLIVSHSPTGITYETIYQKYFEGKGIPNYWWFPGN